jgi:hypothetical protein
MTDDEILDAIDRRFGEVETRLPPTGLGHLGVVRDLRPPRTGQSLHGMSTAAAFVAVGLIVVATIGIISRPSAQPGQHAAASTTSTPSINRSAAPSRTVDPIPTEPLEIIRDAARDGETALIFRMGWVGCRVTGSFAFRVQADGRVLDAAIDRAGIEEGFVSVDGTDRFFVGPTPASAARAYSSPILIIDRLETNWIVTTQAGNGPVGYQLLRTDTPKGRSTWSLGNSIRLVSCIGG